MARKTNAQRMLEAEQAKQQQFEDKLHGWPTFMMTLLEKAYNEGMKVVPCAMNCVFVVEWDDGSEFCNLVLNPANLDEMNTYDLEWELEHRETERELARQRAELRTKALNKLTKEEREALGV